MANQYTGNFEQIVRTKFKCSAKEILITCKNKGLSYYDAAKFLGFKHVTVRKWANRFDIKLITKIKNKDNEISADKEKNLIKQCKQKSINTINIFSRTWINKDFYKSIKLARS